MLIRRSDGEEDVRVKQIFGRRLTVWTSEDHCQHLLRVVCRARAICEAVSTRRDVEGISRVDVQASSEKPWQTFSKELSGEEARLLNVYRGGASSTPTRRSNLEEVTQHCKKCGQCVWPSMRHYVAECSRYDLVRETASRRYGLGRWFWTNLPRVSSKSGWITLDAHPKKEKRNTHIRIH